MISDNDIKDIESVFPIKFEMRSRLDNYPFFTLDNNNLEINNITECFDALVIGSENDPIYGQKLLVIKINNIKPDFYKYLRKEKLIKLNILF